MVKGAIARAAARARRLAADRPGAGRGDGRGSPRAAARFGIIVWAGRTLDANEALIREMVQQARRRDPALDRARREAGQLDRRRPAPAASTRWRPIRATRCAPRPRRRWPTLAYDLQHDPEMQAKVARLQGRDPRQPGGRRAGSTGCGRARAPACCAPRAIRSATLAGKFGEALRQLGDDAAAGSAAARDDQPVRPAGDGRHGGQLWRRDRHGWSPTRSAAGMRGRSPAGWKRRSAATCNISGSTARSSAGSSAWRSTRSTCCSDQAAAAPDRAAAADGRRAISRKLKSRHRDTPPPAAAKPPSGPRIGRMRGTNRRACRGNVPAHPSSGGCAYRRPCRRRRSADGYVSGRHGVRHHQRPAPRWDRASESKQDQGKAKHRPTLIACRFPQAEQSVLTDQPALTRSISAPTPESFSSSRS